MRSPVTQKNNKEKGKIFYNPDSFSTKLMDIIEEIVGITYIAFSQNTLYKKMMMDPAAEGYKIIKGLDNLMKGNFIKKIKKDQYQLTPKGIRRINFSKFFKLLFQDRKKDGFWRMVIFDIPEKEKIKRELLRQKLKEFDFYMVQKSVFVSPYVCEKEISELCKILNLDNNCVCIVTAKDLGGVEKEVNSYFG